MNNGFRIKKVNYIVKLLMVGAITLSSVEAKSQYKITVTDSNTFVYGNTYLINVPIKKYVNRLYINDDNGKIPVATFVYFTGSADTLIVTNKSKEYIFYIRNYSHYGDTLNGIYIDTLNKIDKKIKHFIDIPKPDTSRDIISYYSIGSGSSLNDGYFETMKKYSDFISAFEKENNVKITGIYGRSSGYEGEGINYYTLQGMSLTQKAKFVNNSRYIFLHSTAKMARILIVVMPTLIPKNNLSKHN
jgi:hypothetical protein